MLTQNNMNVASESCRICLETVNLKSIFKEKCDKNHNTPIWERIVYCAAVQVSEDDSLPKMICNQCLHCLDVAYAFKTMCIATDKKLRSYHNRNETVSYCGNKLEKATIANDLGQKQNKGIQNISIDNDTIESLIEENMHSEEVNTIDLDLVMLESISDSNAYQSEHNSNYNECKISNLSNFVSDTNREEKGNALLEVASSDAEKDIPKDILKVGRHIAKKISGKFPQKLQSNNTNDEMLSNEYLTKDNILFSATNYGNKCHILPNFENISEGDLPVVGFEETVVTDNDVFSLNVHTDTIQYKSIGLEQTNLKQRVIIPNVAKLNISRKDNRKDEISQKIPKVKLKVRSSMTLRRGNKKVNVFDDHHIKIAKRKSKDLVKEGTPKKIKQCFKCDVCSKSFPFRSHLDRHINVHSGIKKYSCDYCQRKFINRYNLSVHLLKHTGQFPLKCMLCSKGFPNPSLLKRHEATHTHEANFQCRYCTVTLRQSSSLRLHERMHLHRPSYHCDICYKVFSYTNSLAAHRKQHFTAKRYTCDTCRSTFSRKSSLIRHIEGHYNTKRIKCKFCGILFNNRNTYNLHIKAHFKYKCDVCGENFQVKTNLVNHIKVHMDILKCEQCFKVFPNKTQLVKHLDKHIV